MVSPAQGHICFVNNSEFYNFNIFNIPKLTVAMIPAPLSDSQESNWRMNSARDQEHYVTRRIPRTPTFCRLRPENAKCRSTSTRVCAGVSKRKATLKITATKRRGLVATRNCERSQRANYGQGPQMSALLTGRTLKKQKARRKEALALEKRKTTAPRRWRGGGGRPHFASQGEASGNLTRLENRSHELTFQSSRLPWFRLHSRTLKKATDELTPRGAKSTT